MQTSSKTCPSNQSQLMTTTEPGNASSPRHNHHFPITPASETHRLRVLTPGWGVYFSSEKQQYSLKPWRRTCGWSRGGTSSASSWSSGSPRVLSADDGWRASSWASDPKACTSYPENKKNRAVRIRKQLEENRKCWDWTFIESAEKLSIIKVHKSKSIKHYFYIAFSFKIVL